MKKVNKPLKGHYLKNKVSAFRFVKEFKTAEAMEPGQTITPNIFKAGDHVDVTGVSKGKGFQGVVKRWHFRGGGGSHGSMFHRAPGSIGSSSDPSRVFKGMRMAGHMGARQATVQNLEIIKVDEEKSLLLVKGAVPGAKDGYLVIIKSIKTTKAKPIPTQDKKQEIKKK